MTNRNKVFSRGRAGVGYQPNIYRNLVWLRGEGEGKHIDQAHRTYIYVTTRNNSKKCRSFSPAFRHFSKKRISDYLPGRRAVAVVPSLPVSRLDAPRPSLGQRRRKKTRTSVRTPWSVGEAPAANSNKRDNTRHRKPPIVPR